MSFKEIYGQDRAKSILKNVLIKKNIPQSYLFFGPKGVGKKLTALNFAKFLNCQNQKEDACDQCNSCQKINKGIHSDLMIINPIEHSIKIEQIRELLQWSSLKPFEGGKKIIIIDPANKMNLNAANALLKLLEETPPNIYIILICENLQNLLPTIISRCQPIKFNRLPANKFDPEKNKEIDFVDLSLFEKNITEEFIIDYCKIFKDFEREEVVEKLNQMMQAVRDLSILKITGNLDTINLPANPDKILKSVEKFSQMILLSIFDIMQETIRMIQFNNTNAQLSMEGMFLKIKAVHEVTNNGKKFKY